MNIIDAQHITIGYKQKIVLSDISFSVAQGEYVGLIGSNGSGKTTLLKTILGLLKPISGTIKLFDVPQSEFTDWNMIGYVSQRATDIDGLFPATVEEIVLMGLYPIKKRFEKITDQDRKLVVQALESVELECKKDVSFKELSGGQKQRALIARALVSSPQLLILDEPTIGIDSKTQIEFYSLLKKLNAKGITIVIVSHDIDTMMHEVKRLVSLDNHYHEHDHTGDAQNTYHA